MFTQRLQNLLSTYITHHNKKSNINIITLMTEHPAAKIILQHLITLLLHILHSTASRICNTRPSLMIPSCHFFLFRCPIVICNFFSRRHPPQTKTVLPIRIFC